MSRSARLRLLALSAAMIALLGCSDAPARARPIASEATSTVAEQAATQRTPAQRLDDARRLDFDGEWEAAEAAYRDALAGGPEIARPARAELARLLLVEGRPREVVTILEPLLSAPGTDDAGRRAWYLLGSARAGLEEWSGAATAYARYTELGGTAAAYARVEQARALLTGDAPDVDGAVSALAPVLDGTAPAYARRLALRAAGEGEEKAGRLDAAVARYQALLDGAAYTSERVFALSRLGAVQEARGDLDAAAAALTALIARYPATADAERALASLRRIGRPADPLSAGLVQYRRGANADARTSLNTYLRAAGSTGEGPAAALFYLGALAERRGDLNLALENYQESYDAAPAGPLAAESLWWHASVLEDAGRPNDAIGAYLTLAQRLPGSTRAADARFRAGFLHYTGGRVGDARALWADVIGLDNTAAARVLFWAARAAGEQGDAAAARAGHEEATRRDPAGYYGLRAGAVLAGSPRAPSGRGGSLNDVAPDWAAAEAWLGTWAGAEPTQGWQTVEDWRAGLELLAVGADTVGTNALELALDVRSDQPWALYRMARALLDGGRPALAQYAAGELIAAAPPGSAPPAAVLRLSYPAPWADLVRDAASRQGVDPLLLYGLIRQESAFNPRAGSTAGAFGLTQFIPGTAGDVARALGRPSFAFSDLQRPSTAIQFGAYYLAAQLKAFDDNLYMALAAYNGGGGNAARWARPGGAGDVDRFYEEIDFSETRTYLRRVLQNFAVYRVLYGGAPAPTLVGG